ncbi:HAAS signaling domain-containing protein [Promicromonospora sp. NPDC090134]|uniref:HAAS signaling domain-containing protein n=1 Tax=Promicromonospora sp. NPDC090134 TaxID=3364408 RepID=UPI0038225151
MTERDTMNANAEDTYLRDVGKRLRTLTPEQRAAVLDDVRAHFADAADAGRSPEQAAESLGDPAQFTERVRAELGHDAGRTDRMRRVLQWLATGAAVFTAMFVSFLWPDQTLPGLNTQVEQYGFGIVLLNLVPALVAALPLFVPVRARTATAVAVATVLTALGVVGDTYMFYAPSAMLAWAALAVPAIARTGRPAAGWRITGAVLTALPAVLLIIGGLVGSWGMEVSSWLWTGGLIAVGALIAVPRTWAGTVVATAGVAVLIMATLDPGMIVLGIWWAGGVLLAVGASHAVAHARPRTPVRD